MAKMAGIGPGSVPHPAADPQRGFDRVLFELSMSDAVTNGDLEGALHEICSTASRALDVARTNVWLFDAAHTMISETVVFSHDHGRPFTSLATAVNVPYFEVDKHLSKLPKDKWIVTYCACPHAEAEEAARQLTKNGYTKVKVMDEGYFGWVDKKYPVEKKNG